MHAFRELAQTLFDTLRLFYRNRRLETEDLYLHLRRHHRQRIQRQGVIIPADICRSGFDIGGQLLLHLLDDHLVADGRHHLLADLRGRFAEILLHLLFRTDLVDVIVQTHVHLVAHTRFVRFHRVDNGLVQE